MEGAGRNEERDLSSDGTPETEDASVQETTSGNAYLLPPKNNFIDPHSLYTPPVKKRPTKLNRKLSREASETESGYLEPIRVQSPSDEIPDNDYYKRIELPYIRQAIEKRNISLTPTPNRALPKPTYYTPQPRRKPPILSPRPDKKILLKKSPSTSSSLKSSISRSTGRSDGSIKDVNTFPVDLPTESEYDCDSYSRPPSPISMTSSVSAENSPVRIPSITKKPSAQTPETMPVNRLNPVERRYSQRLTPTSSPSEHSLRYFSPQFPRRKPHWVPNSPKPDSPITPTKKFINKDGTKSPRSKSPVARQLFTPSPSSTPQPPSASSIPKKKNFFKERSKAVVDEADGAEMLELQTTAHKDSKPDLIGGNFSDASSIGYPNGKSSDLLRTPSICYQSDKDSQSDSSYMYENVSERRRKRRRSAGSMSLRSLAASREVLNDIFKSGRKENKGMKGVIGFCVAIFLGGVLFIGLHYGLYYTEVVSIAITVLSTIFISLGLAFSVRSRCIAALMVPTLCTSRGRAAVLTLTIALLLNGPIKNIIENGNQVSAAMTCNAEVLNKHSEQLQEAALKSFDEYVMNVENSLETIESIATEIQKTVNPLTEGIGRINTELKNTNSFLETSVQKCTGVMTDAYNECRNKLERVYQDCRAELQTVSGVCEPLNLGSLCEIVKIGNGICHIPDLTENVFDLVIIDDVEKIVDDLVDMFEVNVDFVPDWNEARINLTGDPSVIAEQISAKLEDTFGTFDIIILFLDRLVAFSVVYLLYRSYRYHSSYVTKDRFDNFYITKEFREFDKYRRANGQEYILPLKKYEKKKMIDVTTLALSNPEKGSFKIGLVSVILKALMTGIIILVDYGFYWLLVVMHNLYQEINYSASGGGDLSFSVEGDGLMAEFARNLYGEGPKESNTFELQSETEKCIPQPSKPEDRTAIIIGVLYGIIILTVLFQSYALRLRRWIASYYYPEREQARTMYLYNKTLRKRRTLWSMLKQTIKENRREQVAVERISFRAWLAAQNQFCGIILGNKIRVCLGCATEENKSFYICDNPRCSGAYCAECLDQVGNVCSLCDDPIDIESGVPNKT